MDETIKISLFLDKRTLGILQPNGSFGTQNNSDWFITVSLTKEQILDDYISKYKDTFTSSIPRQPFNPYFINYGFFENTNTDEDISNKAPNYNITINK